MSGRKMITSILLLCVMLLTSLAGMSAQTPMPTTMPADRKALTEAAKIKEPDKKIEAMEKVIADFPKSQQAVSSAHQAIFETLIKSYPDQKDRILASANKAIEAAPDFIRSFLCSSLGNKLLDAGIMLDDAARLIQRGLALTEADALKPCICCPDWSSSRAKYRSPIAETHSMGSHRKARPDREGLIVEDIFDFGFGF